MPRLRRRRGAIGSAIVIEDGETCGNSTRTQARKNGKVTAGRILIDSGSNFGSGIDVVEDLVIRDRRTLSEDGIVLAVMALNKKELGQIERAPEVIMPRLWPALTLPMAREMWWRGVSMVLSVEERSDYGVVKEKVRVELKKYIQKTTGRRADGDACRDGDLSLSQTGSWPGGRKPSGQAARHHASLLSLLVESRYGFSSRHFVRRLRASLAWPLERLWCVRRLRGIAGRVMAGQVWLKAESLQPIGSFKLRGAAESDLAAGPTDEIARGVITFSSGNHAQGVAFAAREVGAKAGDRDAVECGRPIKKAAGRLLWGLRWLRGGCGCFGRSG